MATTALIIGGTGSIGSASARALQRAGWDVTLAGRGSHPLPAGLDAPMITVDRSDGYALATAARGFDLVLDTVAFTPDHARQLLDLDVGALIVVSTISVYVDADGRYLDTVTDDASFPAYPVPIPEDWPTIDNAEDTYSPQKAAMERVLLGANQQTSILRAGAVHGPDSAGLREWFFIKRALDGREQVVLARGGGSRFHPASTANLAALVLTCAEQPGLRVLNAVDYQCPTEAEIGAAVFAAMGHEAEIITVDGPPRDGVGVSPWCVPQPIVCATDAAHALGYVAPHSYAASVPADIEWALRTLRAADDAGRSWTDAFPGVLRYGAAEWFDYAAEDRVVAELARS